jgi:hypothetical protein
MASHKLAVLPLGDRATVPHSDGRVVLAVHGNRVLTGGPAQGQGPIVLASVSESSSVERIADSGAGADVDAQATAVAVAPWGDVGIVAEASQNLIGALPLVPGHLQINSLVAQATAKVHALSFSMDGTFL